MNELPPAMDVVTAWEVSNGGGGHYSPSGTKSGPLPKNIVGNKS